MGTPIIEYRTEKAPAPRRTRWWLVFLLLLLTPVILISLMFLFVMMGLVGPD